MHRLLTRLAAAATMTLGINIVPLVDVHLGIIHHVHNVAVAATEASPLDTTTATATAGTPVTATITVTATPSVTATAGTATPAATATATATPRPSPTPNPHPGFGRLPWAGGEYYVWTIAGPHVSGTAWQLLTQSGHQWIDQSAQRESFYGVISTFTSRLAFDTGTYRLRRYDGVQDKPLSVLHATLFGTHLDYTSYLSWKNSGCAVVKKSAPTSTAAYGMMADLVRATPLRPKQIGFYPLFDPYGTRLTVVASYTVVGRETLKTVLGQQQAVRVRFVEGAQPPLDVWYSAGGAHTVLQFAQRGVFTATLAHFEAHSMRASLPVAPVKVTLTGKGAACQ